MHSQWKVLTLARFHKMILIFFGYSHAFHVFLEEKINPGKSRIEQTQCPNSAATATNTKQIHHQNWQWRTCIYLETTIQSCGSQMLCSWVSLFAFWIHAISLSDRNSYSWQHASRKSRALQKQTRTSCQKMQWPILPMIEFEMFFLLSRCHPQTLLDDESNLSTSSCREKTVFSGFDTIPNEV